MPTRNRFSLSSEVRHPGNDHYQMAWWPSNYVAKAAVDHGDIGRVYRLHDFGCYNALWSIWYLAMPQTVYASALHLRPERFPKVEDAATLVLSYPNAVGIFEGSWDLPRSFQDLEVFGRPDNGRPTGSLYMTHAGVQIQVARDKREMTIDPLPVEESELVAYMVSRIQANKPIKGMPGIDMNVKVIRIIDLAKETSRLAGQSK